MKILGVEVLSQVRPVPEDGAVLHQAVLLKDVLAAHDVFAGEEHLAVGIQHAGGNRRMLGVDAEAK